MKKTIVVFSLLATSFLAKGQSYLGYYHDNYAGVQSVLFNPSSIADSRFRADINLFSGSLMAANDYYAVKATDLLKKGYDFANQAKLSPTTNNNFNTNIDIMGPSFMFNLKPKHSIAVFTRARAIVNINDINGALIEELRNDFNTSTGFDINSGKFNAVIHSWAELGLSYATVLLERQKHFLKGGLSLKYLQGAGNSYIIGDNFRLINNAGSSTIASNGTVTYGGSQDIKKIEDDFTIDTQAKGLGLDLGFTYEYRPEFKNTTQNKYKLRLGVAVTDLGSINYKTGEQTKYVMNRTITEADYLNAGNAKDVLNLLDPNPVTEKYTKVVLPTAFHANLDYNLYRKFYINLNTDLNINGRAINTNTIANTVSVTPRYETKWFSAYLPITHMDYSGTQAGLGMRLGPVFVGSGSVLTNLLSDQTKAFDVHVGVKIPIYKGAKKEIISITPTAQVVEETIQEKAEEKDSDSDTVLDKDDKCPTLAGPAENQGCPWADTDADSVLDKDDKCPTVVGVPENEGCPWPDTDSDTVLDKDDKCPTIKGTVNNNGCPEVSNEVIKKLNDYGKTILFNKGKFTFQKSTFSVLQAMVIILKEYPASKFSIEGHTDSDGAAIANQKLSEGRATAIMKYLVTNGIDQSRLVAKGYGESKPIASNKTNAGKIKNRRVEVKLLP